MIFLWMFRIYNGGPCHDCAHFCKVDVNIPDVGLDICFFFHEPAFDEFLEALPTQALQVLIPRTNCPGTEELSILLHLSK
jgi:hypothetical protein